MAIKHLNIKVLGFVQGVGFRWFAKKEAERLRLAGFARNEPDGSLYLEIEGEEEKLHEFIAWCSKGPPSAEVKDIRIFWSDELTNFRGFMIK